MGLSVVGSLIEPSSFGEQGMNVAAICFAQRLLDVTIFCRSVVDVIRQASPASKELSLYRVTVEGREPHDYVRMYDIQARTEDVAAKEGLQRFQDEIGKLIANEEGCG